MDAWVEQSPCILNNNVWWEIYTKSRQYIDIKSDAEMTPTKSHRMSVDKTYFMKQSDTIF